MHPMFSIDQCPICHGGLCGIRICGFDTDHPHGMVVCDECEAVWMQPDIKSRHQYPDSRDARCPTCSAALWGPASRWADWEDVQRLGWESLIDPGLVWEDETSWNRQIERCADLNEPPPNETL